MKSFVVCAFIGALVFLSAAADETKEFMDDMAKISETARKAAGSLDTDTEKAIEGFVTKYGKARFCKYFEAEWKKMGENKDKEADGNATLKKSCDDSTQGDKEFIQTLKDLFVKEFKQ